MVNIEWTSVIETFIGTFCGAALAFGSSIFVDYFTRKKNRNERIEVLLLMIQENANNINNIKKKLEANLDNGKLRNALSEIRDDKDNSYRLYPVRNIYDNILRDVFRSCKTQNVRSAIKQVVEMQYFLYGKMQDTVSEEDSNDKIKIATQSILILIASHDKAMMRIEDYINQHNANLNC